MATDYAKLGLKAGLEIHRQLDTKTKLFCNCPAKIRDDRPDVVVQRKLRASAGEAGKIDPAAAYEQQRDRHFVYGGYNDSVCAIELDEEPVHDMNPEALKTGLQVALLLKTRPVYGAIVMRKTVIDGSNTSGFQRTTLIARNGFIELLSGKVRISSVCLEEDSAKIVERSDSCNVYNLSRLGIPLVEIATEADITGPEQLREVAEYIGMILRSTGKVKRGLGTIRQDVNVSIKGGSRVEIKGAQDLRLLQKLVEYEALRQKNLLELVRELKNAEISEKITDVSSIFTGSNSKMIKATLAKNGAVKAIKLKNFKGLVGREIQPDRRLGTELSDYAKAFGKVSGIIHSDELPGFGITQEEVGKINAALGCGDSDAFALVAAERSRAEKALNAVIARAKQAKKGVPKEVRKSNANGTTTFLRPMSGSARMYPETDVKIMRPTAEGIKLPQLITEKAAGYESIGVGRDLAHTLVKTGAEQFFEEMTEQFSRINASFLAETLVSFGKEMERRGLDHTGINDGHLKEVFSALNESRIAKESVMDALADVAAGQSLNLERYRTMTDAELDKTLRKLVDENPGMPLKALTGKAMGKLRGKAAGKKVVDSLKKLQKNR